MKHELPRSRVVIDHGHSRLSKRMENGSVQFDQSAIFPKRPIGSGVETQMLAYHRQNIVTLNVGQISSSDFCAEIPTAKRSGRILHSTDLQQHPGNGWQG